MTPDDLRIELRDAVESRAVLDIEGIDREAQRGFRASLHGPSCRYARTLSSYYDAAPIGLDPSGGEGAMRTEIVIPEPCYWSPALPFLYELRCEWSDGANDARELRLAIGLRRLEPRKRSLYWDGKRIVLRGLRVATVPPSAVEEGRAAEVAFLIPHPTTETCELADEHGLPLIADLRGGELEPQAVRSLALHPSVTMMLIDGHQIRPCKPGHLPRGTLIAAAMNPVRDGHVSAQQPPDWADIIAVELEPGGRPPAWIDHARRPVIAIRGNGPYADFQIARAACDRLQAVLAPDFDLAGYFV